MDDLDSSTPDKQIGSIAYFQPAILKIDGTGIADDSAIPCKVVRVSFDPGKVLYDLALPNGEGGFYENYPIRCVDSYFVLRAPADN